MSNMSMEVMFGFLYILYQLSQILDDSLELWFLTLQILVLCRQAKLPDLDILIYVKTATFLELFSLLNLSDNIAKIFICRCCQLSNLIHCFTQISMVWLNVILYLCKCCLLFESSFLDCYSHLLSLDIRCLKLWWVYNIVDSLPSEFNIVLHIIRGFLQ